MDDRPLAALERGGIAERGDDAGEEAIEYEELALARELLARARDGAEPLLERLHPAQMYQLYPALKLNGVPADLVLYPREPHGLLERQHQLDYMGRIVEAFNKYVRPAERPTT